MKKILIIDFNGTSSVFTHYLANGLKSNKDNIYILGKTKPKFLNVFTESNRYLGYFTGIKLIDYFINWLWLLLNHKEFDLIVIQWLQILKYISIEVFFVSYIQRKTTLVYLVHNLYPHNTNSKGVKRRYNFLYRRCNNIAVQTTEMRKRVSELAPNTRIFKIHHGLFFREFRTNKLSTNKLKCLMIGYISKYKGVEDALDILEILKNRKTNIFLEIIGFGNPDYVAFLNLKIKKMNLIDSVKIISEEVSTNFIINKVNESAMLWLPYKEISQSGVSYTAMGLGSPIVGYDVGNFKEVFSGKGIAEIVDKGDIIQFSNAVEKVMSDNDYYKMNIRKVYNDDLWSLNKTILNKLLE